MTWDNSKINLLAGEGEEKNNGTKGM